MKLSRFTDYALRALIYLSSVEPERPTTETMATAFGVSQTHMVKVVNELGNAGFVRNHRGRGGGVELARPPEEIHVGAVVRRLESMDLVECFTPETNACPIAPVCLIKPALADAAEAFLVSLDAVTLADLTPPKSLPKLRKILAIQKA